MYARKCLQKPRNICESEEVNWSHFETETLSQWCEAMRSVPWWLWARSASNAINTLDRTLTTCIELVPGFAWKVEGIFK